jgi:hypothetical protein
MDDANLKDKFFDSHIHLYNMSHAGFLAYINRLLLNQSISMEDILEKKFFTIIRGIFTSLNPLSRILFVAGSIILVLLPFTAGYFITTGIYTHYISDPSLLLLAAMGTCIAAEILLTAIILLIITALFNPILAKYTALAVNLLSITENDIASILLCLELDYIYVYLEYLKGKDQFMKIMETIRGKIKNREFDNQWKIEEYIYHHILKVKEKENPFCYKVGSLEIPRIILTPLMMDFRGKGYSGNGRIYYNLPPYKPIVDQVIDIFNGLKSYHQKSFFHLFEVYPFMGISPPYYDYNPGALIPIPGNLYDTTGEKIKNKLAQCFRKDKQEDCMLILENKIGIYKNVFLKDEEKAEKNEYIIIAIETITEKEKDDLLDAIDMPGKSRSEIELLIHTIYEESDKNSIQKLFYKYFGDYKSNDGLYDRFYQNYQYYFKNEAFDGNIDSLRSHFFSGLKLYPALGYDPWPCGDLSVENPGPGQILEQKKVEFIYNFCEAKQIPITVHCQNSSFSTIDKKTERKNTHPVKWKPILKKYPGLKLNFAHMGLVDEGPPPPSHQWTETIISFMKEKNSSGKSKYPNIYADFACKGRRKGNYDFYAFFSLLLEKYKKAGLFDIKKRILFGTDFPMQLYEDQSYKSYISCFFNAGKNNFSDRDKKLFYNINPARFIFNKNV